MLGLLVVADEVLGRGDHALRLRPAHERGAETAGQVGVLAVGFEHAAGARVAHHVDRRREQPVAPLGASLDGDRAADARREVGVPGGGDRDGGREGGGAIGVPVEVAPHRLADPCGPSAVSNAGTSSRRLTVPRICPVPWSCATFSSSVIDASRPSTSVSASTARRHAERSHRNVTTSWWTTADQSDDGEGDEERDGARGWPMGARCGGAALNGAEV